MIMLEICQTRPANSMNLEWRSFVYEQIFQRENDVCGGDILRETGMGVDCVTLSLTRWGELSCEATPTEQNSSPQEYDGLCDGCACLQARWDSDNHVRSRRNSSNRPLPPLATCVHRRPTDRHTDGHGCEINTNRKTDNKNGGEIKEINKCRQRNILENLDKPGNVQRKRGRDKWTVRGERDCQTDTNRILLR